MQYFYEENGAIQWIFVHQIRFEQPEVSVLRNRLDVTIIMNYTT